MIAAVLVCLKGNSAEAVIYRFKDANGVLHFTNVPNHPGFRPFYGLRSVPLKKYDRFIHQVAKRHGLEPSLIRAVIKAESDFQEAAVSSKGAMGLMQLMPETAKDMNVSNPFDARQNIEGGVRYLDQLLRQFGELRLALAAYNAGPSTVVKHGGIPPFEETREFIIRVMKYYNEYGL